MLTIEEAIEHAEDIAVSAIGCECREEHRQLVPHGSVNLSSAGKHRRLCIAVSASTFSAICVLTVMCRKVLTLMSAVIGAVDATRWIIAVTEIERKGEPTNDEVGS